MKTQLEGTDRWGSLVIGLGIAIYSMIGGYDKLAVQVPMFVIGLGLMAGGICGT